MARMPGTIWVGEQSPRTPMSRYDIVCVHTIVGYAPAHAAHFSTHGDGRTEQSRDTLYRSAANLDGNHRIIAIENEDHGNPFPAWGGSDVPALSDEQVESCARILAWAHHEHDVPLQLCPDSRPGSRGLAYHRQGCDGTFTDGHPGRVSGGEVWTSSFGKVCPGGRRIAQLPLILARAREIAYPKENPLMAVTEKDFDALAENVADIKIAVGDVRDALSTLRQKEAQRFQAQIKELRGQGKTDRQILEQLQAEAG
ncbi:peptidoglycan recognition protein family protein [Nocardioides sp. AX2bis]|uniref:peptidoglycan recognition protein family protein n=1 Tax=Nocardioides sp. AX2bis TaxID=2653157 RepID=UPI0012F180E2|nr:N-acetylmuramoyl-L-alanine amidase [Nocardioides sp. AX2bis]VXC42825.1 hypothetical protein NOCARDAX2BIS_540004 [Nocardioides sp. AX2bis]